jgi:hypothetical protein
VPSTTRGNASGWAGCWIKFNRGYTWEVPNESEGWVRSP